MQVVFDQLAEDLLVDEVAVSQVSAETGAPTAAILSLRTRW
jgi:hypothetical protein